MGSLNDLLEDKERGSQLYKYIKDRWKNKIVSPKTALKFGTLKIGTRSKQDSNLSFSNKTSEFYRIRQEARRGDMSARDSLLENSRLIYSKKLEELSIKFNTKSGKEYNGRIIGKYIVEREIRYQDKRTGHMITYLQKRSLKTGRAVKN